MKTKFVRGALGCLALAFAALPACSSGEPESVGTLELALRAQGSQGSLYGLRGRFVLNDPEQLGVTATELETTSTATLTPRVGSYQLELCSGGSANARCAPPVQPFQLFKLTCLDPMIPANACSPLQLQATPVMGAVLNTANPQNVSILANQSTTATFAFTVPGEGNITFARGSLNINVSVTQGFADGQACSTGVECQSKICSGGVCAAASCTDGVQNGGELGPDCGGTCANVCPGAGMCNPACPASMVCQAGACVVPGGMSSCTDGVQNGGELGVDCGGPCPNACMGAGMCNPACPASMVCQAGACVVPGGMSSCTDGVQNGGELGVDCGGPCPNACTGGMSSCADGVQNGAELGVDCGGPCPNACPGAASCMDGVRNGAEAGTDCGGTCAVQCLPGTACVLGSFCGPGRPCAPGGSCP